MYQTITKTIVAWLFNNYVAYYYFDNININQLKVAFNNGQVELEDLPIKQDALRHLRIPWKVISGTVGKLVVQIPLLSLLTEPWDIALSEVTLIVSPNYKSQMKMIQESSQPSVSDYLDEPALAENLVPNSEETKLAEFYKSFSTTVSSMVKDVFRNIRLEIGSIQIIFEDNKAGVNKFRADKISLARPDSERRLVMKNASIYFSEIGSNTFTRHEDLFRFNISSCDLGIRDVAPGESPNSFEFISDYDILGSLFIDGAPSIPVANFLLEDFRLLFYSCDQQQDGSVFARISCCHFNRETSSWDALLQPWPFNLSWDKRVDLRRISLTSDELAEFSISSALLDLVDVIIKRVASDSTRSKLWPVIVKSSNTSSQNITQDNDSIYLLKNETGYRVFYKLLEIQGDTIDEIDRSKSASPTMSNGGEQISPVLQKISICSKSSTEYDRDSSDCQQLSRWSAIDTSDTVPIGAVRTMLVRVEGWKTLLPIHADRTGLFFREASSDRVKNEDTHIVISIELDEKSARKIITIRSPLKIVNQLDATLEVHFADINQALYVKPEGELAVPLPCLFSRMHVRPCNVGVNMSEEPLFWDDIREVDSYESKIHICYPITMTDKKHASYCTSQAYRVCASVLREEPKKDVGEYTTPAPVYSLTFLPPLTIVNLLPCELRYFIADVNGSLSKGSPQRIHHADLTQPTNIHFEMNGYPRSKPIKIDPGATGSFQYTLEMFDKTNRSLYLNAKIILASLGEEPAMQIIISAPYWLINKTKLPIVVKQEGAAAEAAGQYREHEERPTPVLLFSFYETEQEPPWLCSMRIGKAKGASMWCEGFKLEKGTGQRRLCYMPKRGDGDSKMSRSMVDINIIRGPGKFSDTMIVTLTTRYGFENLTKTPKKVYESSPQDYKLTYYNYNTNLAQQIGGRSTRMLFDHHNRNIKLDLNIIGPGIKLTLLDNLREKIAEVAIEKIVIKSTTKAKEQIIDCSIQDVRIENLMPDCEKTMILDRASTSHNQSLNSSPALRLIIDRIIGRSFGTIWFKQVQISMCELFLNIEEKLFMKLVEFISFRNRKAKRDMGNLSRDLDRIMHPEEDRRSKYYFDLLRIDLSSLKLSVYTATTLPESLQKLKTISGLKFFGFEDARVQLAPYFKMNVSRTLGGIFDSVTRFYKRQISEQAPRIVGQQIQNYLRFHLSDLLSSLYDEVYNKLFY